MTGPIFRPTDPRPVDVKKLNQLSDHAYTAPAWADITGRPAPVDALLGVNTGDQTITLTGNVTGSGTGSFATTIADGAVTYAKMQDVSAGDKVLGRISGAGDVEEIAATAAGRAFLGSTGTSGTYLYFSATNVLTNQTITTAGRALIGQAGVADEAPYYTGTTSVSRYSLTAFGRSLAGAADATAGRAVLGLATGDAVTFGGVTTTGAVNAQGGMNVGNGTAAVASYFNGSATLGGAVITQRNGANHTFIGDYAAAYGSGSGVLLYAYSNNNISLNNATTGNLATVSPTGVNIPTGRTYQINGTNIFANTPLTGTTTAAAIAATGAITSSGGSIGYATGAGGTVTQATNKATGVTLNKQTGEITMNAAALAAATTVTFVLTNSTLAAGDMIVCAHHATGAFASYNLNARVTGAGAASIAVRNITAGSLSEAIVIKYVVIKAVTA